MKYLIILSIIVVLCGAGCSSEINESDYCEQYKNTNLAFVPARCVRFFVQPATSTTSNQPAKLVK